MYMCFLYLTRKNIIKKNDNDCTYNKRVIKKRVRIKVIRD